MYTSIDRKQLPHIVAAKNRIENLWAAGTDYCAEGTKMAMQENRMLHLDLDLTGECNLKCFYCDRTPDRFNDVVQRIELTTEERINLITEAKALGATTVEFPGAGEPMMDAGFWKIVEHIHALCMIPVIFTSGWYLDDEAIQRLYELNATIFIKYNSSDTQVQDKMVGVKGYGEKAKYALKKLVQTGFNRTIPTRMAIDMVVTPKYHEQGEIEDIFRWCRDNNVHNYIMTLIPEGMADKKQLLLERERADRLVESLYQIDLNEYGLEYTPSRPMGGGYKCRQINVGIFVNLFGEVYDCNGLSRIIGHTKESSLEKIWNSSYSKSIREKDQNGLCPPRERVWSGVDCSGMERKIQPYQRWKEAGNECVDVVRKAIHRTVGDSTLVNSKKGTYIIKQVA